MFRKILFALGGLLFIVALVAAVGLGMWAYRLNTELAQSRTDYQALQTKYDELDSEYSVAKAEFEAKSDQAKADLDDAEAQVAKLQIEVGKLESENKSLRTRLAKIQNSVAMLSDFWFMSDSVFERKVNASDDQELKRLYAKLQESQQWDDAIEIMSYMIQSIADVSNVSWQPVLEVESSVEVGVVQ